jgi:hypothetical protein
VSLAFCWEGREALNTADWVMDEVGMSREIGSEPPNYCSVTRGMQATPPLPLME